MPREKTLQVLFNLTEWKKLKKKLTNNSVKDYVKGCLGFRVFSIIIFFGKQILFHLSSLLLMGKMNFRRCQIGGYKYYLCRLLPM